MKRTEIEIDGKRYPCYSTMGAFLIFKEQTARDVETLSGTADMVIYLWACCKSACRREGLDFPLGLEQFADALTPDGLTHATAALQQKEPAAEEGEADAKNA